MLVKIVTFFLIFMAVMAMFGRLRWPGVLGRPRDPDKANKLRRPRKCPKCGAFRVGRGPCPCGKTD